MFQICSLKLTQILSVLFLVYCIFHFKCDSVRVLLFVRNFLELHMIVM